MKELLSRAVVFMQDEEGAAAAELGILAACILAGCIAMLAALEPALGISFESFGGRI